MQVTKADYFFALDNGYQGTLEQFMEEHKDGVDYVEAIEGLRRQLHAARYAFHKLAQQRYREYMQNGMDKREAKTGYDMQMANYDGIIRNAINGHSQMANDEDMKKGFDL